MHPIYIDLTKPNASATLTLKLWIHMPSSITWLLQDTNSNTETVYNGKCIMLVISLAMLVEGFITDLLINQSEKIESNVAVKKIKKIKTEGTWKSKTALFKEVFKKEISTFINYKSIDSLFTLRNNIAHGRTYTEEVVFRGETNYNKIVHNENYNKVKS